MTTRMNNRTKKLVNRFVALFVVFAIASMFLLATVPFMKSTLVYGGAMHALKEVHKSIEKSGRTNELTLAEHRAQDRIDDLAEKDSVFHFLYTNRTTRFGVLVKWIVVITMTVCFLVGIAGYIFTGYVIYRDAPIIFRNSRLANRNNANKKSKLNHIDYAPSSAKTR